MITALAGRNLSVGCKASPSLTDIGTNRAKRRRRASDVDRTRAYMVLSDFYRFKRGHDETFSF
jgi:hypothetical protein